MANSVMVLIKGYPGVGKSTLARCVCQHQRWPLIDKDDARDCLQTLGPEVLQSVEANQLSYDIMFRYCQTQLSLGLSVVVDCPFARVDLYDAAVSVAHKCGAAVAVIDVTVSDQQLWQQRLEIRAQREAGSHTRHKPQTWQEIQQLMKRYNGCWQWSTDGSRQLQHHLLVDTAQCSLEDNLQAVLKFLKRITQ